MSEEVFKQEAAPAAAPAEEAAPVAAEVAPAAEAAAPAAAKPARGVRKTRTGTVVSKSGDKSVVVRGERRLPHPVYGKVVRRFRKYHCHDEKNECKVGDIVEIVECRPLSKMKRWRVVAKIAEAK